MMKYIQKYLLWVLILVCAIWIIFLTSNNRDTRVERNYLKKENTGIKQENKQLQEGRAVLYQRVDSAIVLLQKQNRVISELELQKQKVRIIKITVPEVDTLDREEVVRQINEGRQCCAELVIAEKIITKLQIKSISQDSLIIDQGRIIISLRQEVENVNLMMDNINAIVKTYVKENRRLKAQKVGLLISNGVTIILAVVALL